MNLTHKIALDPTHQQRGYFARAAGTHRFVWNLALEEWNCQYASGGKPSGQKLKAAFNADKYDRYPWLKDIHRDAHAQPFADLQAAFGNFFAGRADKPAFKRKGEHDAFYVANDKLSLSSTHVRLPKVGKVRIREPLRFAGKIASTRVVREADRWFLCVSVDLGEYHKERTGNGVVGVDLGLTIMATLSTGEKVQNPRPLQKAQERLARAQRKVSRRVKGSLNRHKQKKRVARIHQCVKNIRHDGLHKLTTRCCHENQVVAIEDLNVSGMVQNHRLARSISDVGFREFRIMLGYKAKIYGTRLVVADRFFPSSKTCSACGCIKDTLSLAERVFECAACGLRIDRDLNAALNLEQLGRASAEVTTTDMPGGVNEVVTTPRANSRRLTK